MNLTQQKLYPIEIPIQSSIEFTLTWFKFCSAAFRSSGLGLRAAWSITARLGRSIASKSQKHDQNKKASIKTENENWWCGDESKPWEDILLGFRTPAREEMNRTEKSLWWICEEEWDERERNEVEIVWRLFKLLGFTLTGF